MKKQTVRPAAILFLLLCMVAAGTILLPHGQKQAAVSSHESAKVPPSKQANTPDGGHAALALKRAEIDHYLSHAGFSGSAVVVSHGYVVLNKGYGYSNFLLRRPNRPETEYFIGSITKSVTGVAFMQMEERGLISFGTPVSRFYPAFPHGRSITMLDLLCHVSGLRSEPETFKRVTRDELVQRIADYNIRLLSPPGTHWAYMDANYALVAAILDRISQNTYGETLHQFIQQNIFNRAGLKQAGFGNGIYQSALASIGYGRFNEPVPVPSFSQLLGCGDVYMSAWDLYQFDRALAAGMLVSDSSYHSIFTKHFSGVPYSLGWYTSRRDWGNDIYSSHGVLGGWNGGNAFSFDRQNYVVLLANSSQSLGIIGPANQTIFKILKG